MAEILFYHLQRQPLDAVLPKLVERSLDRGWTVVVQAVTAERMAALDDLLWTCSEESFLPHATDRDPDVAREPIVLTVKDGNPNGAAVRFLVEGAGIPAEPDRYERIVVLFDGQDEDALAVARKTWSSLKAKGLKPTYWQQDDAGRWEKKA